MVAPFRLPLCFSLFFAVALIGCVYKPEPLPPHKKLQLETLHHPYGGTTTYVFREVDE